MTWATAIMVTLAALLSILAWREGPSRMTAGWRRGLDTLLDALPVMIPAFLVAGLLPLALPPHWVSSLLGDEAGIGGVAAAAVLGGTLAGGPYVIFPIIQAIHLAGAGLAAGVALVAGWSTLNLGRLPFEFAILGWRFTVIRLAVTWWIPVAAGLVTWFWIA